MHLKEILGSALLLISTATATTSSFTVQPTCTQDKCLSQFTVHPTYATSVCKSFSTTIPTSNPFPNVCSGSFNTRVSSVCTCLGFAAKTTSSSKSASTSTSTKATSTSSAITKIQSTSSKSTSSSVQSSTSSASSTSIPSSTSNPSSTSSTSRISSTSSTAQATTSSTSSTVQATTSSTSSTSSITSHSTNNTTSVTSTSSVTTSATSISASSSVPASSNSTKAITTPTNSSTTTTTTPTTSATCNTTLIINSNPSFEQIGPDGTNSYPWTLYTPSAAQVLPNSQLPHQTPYGTHAAILWTDRWFLGSFISQQINLTAFTSNTSTSFNLSYAYNFAPPVYSNTDSWTITAQLGGQTVDMLTLTAGNGDGVWYNRSVPVVVASGGFGPSVELLVSFVYSGYQSSSWNEAWLEVDGVVLAANATGSC